MTTTVTTPILTAGTWTADTVHSDVAFKVRHMAVGKAKGTFDLKSATLVVDENGAHSVTAEIDAATPRRSSSAPRRRRPRRSSSAALTNVAVVGLECQESSS